MLFLALNNTFCFLFSASWQQHPTKEKSVSDTDLSTDWHEQCHRLWMGSCKIWSQWYPVNRLHPEGKDYYHQQGVRWELGWMDMPFLWKRRHPGKRNIPCSTDGLVLSSGHFLYKCKKNNVKIYYHISDKTMNVHEKYSFIWLVLYCVFCYSWSNWAKIERSVT